MENFPSEAAGLFEDISAQFPGLLGDNLIGIYLYGSLTQSAFDPARSDIDMVVATRRELDDEEFAAIGEWLADSAAQNEWTTRLQIMILAAEDILKVDAKACLYQFGEFTRGGSDGNPIPWINVLKSGITLYGPPASTFVPEITPEIFFETLVRELGYLREALTEKPNSQWRGVPKYRAYVVLTICRILYSRQKSTIVSKPRAAIWALKKLSAQWHPLILAALDHDAGRPAKLPLRPIRKFVEYAARELTGSSADNSRPPPFRFAHNSNTFSAHLKKDG